MAPDAILSRKKGQQFNISANIPLRHADVMFGEDRPVEFRMRHGRNICDLREPMDRVAHPLLADDGGMEETSNGIFPLKCCISTRFCAARCERFEPGVQRRPQLRPPRPAPMMIASN
jgi:hypothetical protein